MEKNTTADFNLKRFLLELLLDIVIVVLMVVVIRSFLFAPYRVHGPSMCDTFNVYNGECYNGDGELILVSRLSTWSIFGFSFSSLERGDVVVFEAPYSEEKEFYIKRVVGLPGDTLKIENGYVYLQDENGVFVQLSESYLNEDNLGHTYAYRVSSQTFVVPEDEYFVLGDNRTKSNDARRCFEQLGCDDESSPYLSMDSIQGKVKLVLFPFSHFRFVGDVDYGL